MCRHALSYHLPAGLQPWVRRGPGRYKGQAHEYRAFSPACPCLDPHLQEGFSRPGEAALPDILGQSYVLAHVANLYPGTTKAWLHATI